MAVHDLPFERLVALSELATGSRPQRFDLFAGALSPPSRPTRLLAADGSARTVEQQYQSMLPVVSVYAMAGHVLGRAGATQGDSVFWREDCHPNYLRDAFAGDDGVPRDWAGTLGDAAAEIVETDHPVASVLHPNTIYGHALLEMLPRIWLVDLLARMGRTLDVALDIGAPDWLAGMVGLFIPPERIVRFDGRQQVLRAPSIVVPSMMQVDYYLHPAFNLMAEAVLDRVLGTGPRPAPDRRLFLSRRGYAGGSLSVIENAEALEHRIASAGFEVLRPESMTFAEQIRAYAAASMIVSEYGSASHNSLFAPLGCPQIVLNRLNGVQEQIAAARDQPLGIVEPHGGYVPRLNSDTATVRPRPVNADALLRLVDRMDEHRPSRAGRAALAPLAVPLAAGTVTTGLFVAGMADIGDKTVLASSIRVRLPEFLHGGAIDPAIAPFARLFVEPSPRGYTAQAVSCGRLSGASLLGDSGLVLWRGQWVADTVGSGDLSRASRIELQAGPDGRPVTIPLDQRSHPGRMLYAAFTGRWAEDAGFLAECLPRLVAFTRLVAAGTATTAVVPASVPGSIQARALELLGLDAVETAAPGQIVTGGQLWLPSGIDPWEPSPLVVEAARALSALVPATAEPTPTRLYLRGHAGARPPMADLDALEPVLRDHGFTTVVLAHLDLDSRIRLLRGAEFVVGEAAGGLGHIAFCEPGARVLEFFNPASVQPPHYALAALAGLGYGFVVGRHVAEPGFEEPSLASGYAVDPDRLTAALLDLLRPAPPSAALPGGWTLDPARRLPLPRPFFAAPALPETALDGPALRLVPQAGLALDGQGRVGPVHPDAKPIAGAVIATLAPDPLAGVLPRLVAARAIRERHPEARIVLPPAGPARRIAELLGLTEFTVTLHPDAALTAETVWTVEGLDTPGALPPDLWRRCGVALREAVPVIDAEAMGLLPTRVHLCAGAPDPLLDRALSPRAFVPVVWPHLSIDEQVRLMRVARWIVVEPGMGAALALAHPDARVLEAGHPTARALAASCALDYGCVGDAAQLGGAVAALLA